MPKDCGCAKEEKGKINQIWVYKNQCKKTNIPDNSYVGKIGFTYYLIDNDKKKTLNTNLILDFLI